MGAPYGDTGGVPGGKGSKLLTRVNVTLTDLDPVQIDAAPVQIKCALKCGTGLPKIGSACDSAEVRMKTPDSAEKIGGRRIGHQTVKRCKSVIAMEPPRSDGT
jgi:hypothetical protein